MVLPTGEVIWCSRRSNRDLFDHVPGGLGQFGVITKLRIPLRRYRPQTKVFTVACSNLEELIDAIRRLMSEGCPGIVDLGGIIVESKPTCNVPSEADPVDTSYGLR